MTTENSNAVETPTTAPSSKMELNDRTRGRILYEENALAKKLTRLTVLAEGSKARANCLRSIAATEQLIASLKSQLAARLEKQAAKAAKDVEHAVIEAAPSNDPEVSVEEEVAV